MTRSTRCRGAVTLLLALSATAATACGSDGAGRVALPAAPAATATASATIAAPHIVVSGSLVEIHDLRRDPAEVSAWAHTTPGNPGDTSGAYVVVTNKGGAVDRLVAASVGAGVARTVEMYGTVRVGDTLTVVPVTGWDVAANGGKLTLEPGGNHLVLLNLPAALVAGTRFPLTLKFEKAGAVVVDVEVRAAAGSR